MSNYDKFYNFFLQFGYSDKQIDEIWEILKEYDKKINNQICNCEIQPCSLH